MSKCKYTSIGGQALIEGIMMKSPTKTAMAVRTKEGEIEICDVKDLNLKKKCKLFTLPFVRGVVAFIESMRKKYWNATHNCFAYVIGEHFGVQRCSDDGEPSGTAGKPMLDVLLGEEIHDVAVVVTRYFGGTLLGTGGLVRAYSGSTKEGLLASKVITKMHGQKLSVQTDYTGLGKIQYIQHGGILKRIPMNDTDLG